MRARACTLVRTRKLLKLLRTKSDLLRHLPSPPVGRIGFGLAVVTTGGADRVGEEIE